jgi:iron complex transport system ATP-binding protein
LKDISFFARGGELIALVGPNGAGKSTLLRALMGIVPHRGECCWYGEGLSIWDRRALARKVSYLPQRCSFPPAATVSDLLHAASYPLIVDKVENQKSICQALALVGISEWSPRVLAELSGGELQRAFLAATLVNNPDVLLLDEPATFLDPLEQSRILRLCVDLASSGKLIIAVTHDLRSVGRVYSRVIGIDGGAIVYDGSAKDFVPVAATRLFKLSARQSEMVL